MTRAELADRVRSKLRANGAAEPVIALVFKVSPSDASLERLARKLGAIGADEGLA